MKKIKTDHFPGALIGIAIISREGLLNEVPVYSVKKILTELVSYGMSRDEAYEYFNFNIEGAYLGPATPVYVYD